MKPIIYNSMCGLRLIAAVFTVLVMQISICIQSQPGPPLSAMSTQVIFLLDYSSLLKRFPLNKIAVIYLIIGPTVISPILSSLARGTYTLLSSSTQTLSLTLPHSKEKTA